MWCRVGREGVFRDRQFPACSCRMVPSDSHLHTPPTQHASGVRVENCSILAAMSTSYSQSSAPPELQEIKARVGDGSRWTPNFCEDLCCYGIRDEYTWGFRIYRTVYSPGSDAEFEKAMVTLEAYQRSECFEDVVGRRGPTNKKMTTIFLPIHPALMTATRRKTKRIWTTTTILIPMETRTKKIKRKSKEKS